MNKTFDPEKKLYTLSLLVQDIPGVLSQVARLFSRKGYNIESIVSGETSQPGLTRITIVILGDELMVNQIARQCRKLIPVQVVKILDEETSIQREFAMIKVRAEDRAARDEVIQMANIFRANIIDVSGRPLPWPSSGIRARPPPSSACCPTSASWRWPRRALWPSSGASAPSMMTASSAPSTITAKTCCDPSVNPSAGRGPRPRRFEL